MYENSEPISKSNVSVTKLDPSRFSHEWKEAVGQSEPADQSNNTHPIKLVLPIPDKNESLFFLNETDYYHSRYKTLTTLRRKGANAGFLDYAITSNVLEHFDFQKRRHPMLNYQYVLFPLTRAKHSTWLNPLFLDEVQEEPDRTFVTIASGPGIIVPTTKQTIIYYATNALLAFACSQLDMFPYEVGITKRPIDLISFPDTPFGRQLARQKALKKFPMEPGMFYREYYRQEALRAVAEDLNPQPIY